MPVTTSPRLEAPEPLTLRVVRGVGWAFAGKLTRRAFSLVRTVVLARLLAPEDFGLFGICLLAIGTLETFTETGFVHSLVQRRRDVEAYLDAAWTVSALRGLLLAAVVFVSAPAVGGFFGQPRVVPMLQVLSLSFAVSGVVNVGVMHFQRDLQFGKSFLNQTAAAAASLVVGLVLAYRFRSVWALVAGMLAGEFVNCAVSYLLHPFRPRLVWQGGRAAELFRFGRWMLGSSVVVFLATNGDNALVGKVLGVSALGLYQMAYTLSNMPATEITHIINTVMMPAYARAQDQPARLRRAFLHVLELVLSLNLPLTVFIVLAAPEIVGGVLGPAWRGAVLPLQILVVGGFLRSVMATAGPLFVGTGRPNLEFAMNLARLLVMLPAIYPLTMAWGTVGTSLAVVLGVGAMLPLWGRAFELTGIRYADVQRLLPVPLLLSGCVLLGIGCSTLVPTETALATLLCEAAIVATLGVVCIAVLGIGYRTGPYVQAIQYWSGLRP